MFDFMASFKKIEVDLLATSYGSPSGLSATPMFAFGNPALATGSPLRGVQDDENPDPLLPLYFPDEQPAESSQPGNL